MDKLKPCPFCGGEAFAGGRMQHWRSEANAKWPDGTPITESFFVNCISCGVSTISTLHIGQRDRADAIAAWNHRSPCACERREAKLLEAMDD